MEARLIMTPDVVTARPDMSVQDLKELLARHHISGVPVVIDDGRVVGVVSLSDLLKKSGRSVGDFMTSPAITVDESAGIEEVAAIMSIRGINRIPVLREGRLVGIIARSDIVRYVATHHAWPEVMRRSEGEQRPR